MTPDDAARLLAACAAFDNRQPSQIAMRAWATALKDIPLDQDTFDAVARYYATPPKDAGQRLWIQPHDVVTHRLAIRSERLANFVYEPPAADRDPHYLGRLRGQLHAIGAGQQSAPSAAPMLEGAPHPDVAERIKKAFQRMPGENGAEPEEPKRGVLGVECPTCQARIGNSCRTGRLGTRRRAHRERLAAAGHAVPVPEDAAEITRRKAASAAALAALPPGSVIGPPDGLGPATSFPKESS